MPRPSSQSYDAVVVGAGPNGLTAAVVLADAGLSVVVLEAKETIGGGCRSAALTLPGYVHDVCASIHPMGIVSPIFRTLQLDKHGLAWGTSPRAMAHPFDDGTAAVLMRSPEDTGASLGDDARAWRALMAPFLTRPQAFFDDILRPIRVPGNPLVMARLGWLGLRSCESLVRSRFRGDRARALFAGCAAHSLLPLDAPASASFGLVLALAGHAMDWPCALGGSQRIVDALAARLRAAGGTIETGVEVRTTRDLPSAKVVLFDVHPHQLAQIAGDSFAPAYRRRLQGYRLGPGVFKIDWALSGPIPWTAAECHGAATVHLAGTFGEMVASEDAAARGRVCEKPFVLVAQQSLFDSSRAPVGHHTGWAYCHVPNGSTIDYTVQIENQIERFAPGFRDLVLARVIRPPSAIEAHNPTMIGGDIGGGANDLMQVLFRPFPQIDPYRTPDERFFLCSSSTPPGGGVHGMCGYWAARSALGSRALRGLSA